MNLNAWYCLQIRIEYQRLQEKKWRKEDNICVTYRTMCREYVDYLMCKDIATISSPDGKTLDLGVLGGEY